MKICCNNNEHFKSPIFLFYMRSMSSFRINTAVNSSSLQRLCIFRSLTKTIKMEHFHCLFCLYFVTMQYNIHLRYIFITNIEPITRIRIYFRYKTFSVLLKRPGWAIRMKFGNVFFIIISRHP